MRIFTSRSGESLNSIQEAIVHAIRRARAVAQLDKTRLANDNNYDYKD